MTASRPSPRPPRHSRSRGPLRACDVLAVLLLVACLLGAALVIGGLAADPFSLLG